MGALSSSKTSEDIIKSFAYALRGVGIRTELGRFRFLHFDKQWTTSCDKVHAYCDAYVTKALERMQSGKPATASKGRLRLVDEMARDTQDLLDIRYQILGVFSPGHDSTAVALGNTFFHLARHPEIYQKLRDEILPTKNEPLTFELVRSYKLLEFVLKESMSRLYQMNALQLAYVHIFYSASSYPSCYHEPASMPQNHRTPLWRWKRRPSPFGCSKGGDSRSPLPAHDAG